MSNVKWMDPVSSALRTESHKMSAVSWGSLALGVLWIGYGMFVLSWRVGSLAAVTALAGTALVFGGISQLVVGARAAHSRWLYIVTGVLGIAAGLVAFAWPGATLFVLAVMVAWFLLAFGVMHLVGALAGPKVPWWWTQLLLGIAELGLGIWAVRSWEHSLATLLMVVGTWAIFYGTSEVVAAFSLRHAAKRVENFAG